MAPARVAARSLIAGFVCTALAGCDGPAQTLSITDFRLGPAIPDAPARAAYMTVYNAGPRPRTLVSARSNAYAVVEFHRTETVNEVARMRREQNVVVAPGQRIVFEPFGRHLMLLVPTAGAAAPVTVTVCMADGECIELAGHSG